MKYLQPQIWFEKRGGHDGLPLEFLAHIDTGASNHHGIGPSQAEAMANAAIHWAGYERAKLSAERPNGASFSPDNDLQRPTMTLPKASD